MHVIIWNLPVFILVQLANRLEMLVDYLDISNALITASSRRSAIYAADQVRMNRYAEYANAWTAAAADPAPWVQFDMEQEVTVWGVVVQPTKHFTWGAFFWDVVVHTSEGVTLFNVVHSNDRVNWFDKSGILTADYSVSHISTSWFEEVVTARYWRIRLLAWKTTPSMRADLIGRLKGNKRWFS